MKGATAEPWVSRSRPPKTAITIRSGSSQYFLRTPHEVPEFLQEFHGGSP